MSTFWKKWFTLVELMIVMTLMMWIMALALTQFSNLQRSQCIRQFSDTFSNELNYFQAEGWTRIRGNEFDSLYKERNWLELPSTLCWVEKKWESEYEYFKNLFVVQHQGPKEIYDTESLLNITLNELYSDDQQKEKLYTLVSTFYPEIDKKIFKIEQEEPRKDPVDYKKLLSTVLWFIWKLLIVIFVVGVIIKSFSKVFHSLSQQLRYHRFFTYLLKYRTFKKMIWVGDWVDTELYFTFQQLLLNYELKYSAVTKWSLTVNWKKILTVKWVSNDEEEIDLLKWLSCICKWDEEIDEVLTITVDNFDTTPTYLKRMVIEKIISTIKYNIEVEKITEKTSKVNQERTQLLKEVEKKRSFLDEIKWTTQVKDFSETLSTVVEMEKISREYEALSQKMKALKDKKI